MKLAQHICSNMTEIIGSSLILDDVDDASIEAEDWRIGSLSEAMTTADDESSGSSVGSSLGIRAPARYAWGQCDW